MLLGLAPVVCANVGNLRGDQCPPALPSRSRKNRGRGGCGACHERRRRFPSECRKTWLLVSRRCGPAIRSSNSPRRDTDPAPLHKDAVHEAPGAEWTEAARANPHRSPALQRDDGGANGKPAPGAHLGPHLAAALACQARRSGACHHDSAKRPAVVPAPPQKGNLTRTLRAHPPFGWRRTPAQPGTAPRASGRAAVSSESSLSRGQECG